ncbi:MAG TPA: YciK family oxidoreductase [Spongiibacteraceae bacterium]|jgi:NAD(P)-dependent dehydrogenase (short-subunit alcohol dehydrogenase family)|nr:YciK family oxidoreductase [Spongiibacteraceae bacterium]HUH37497.1 YciK family oxidoreductase [Spongiibacteraceae bacterium]
MTADYLPPAYTPAPDLLKDRVVLVTGAGDGIGRAAALSYAAHGATVILLGKTVEKLERVYDSIEAAGGPQPAIYPMHLNGASARDYEDLHDRLSEEFGRLDGVLHNASVLGPRKPLELISPEQWQEVIQVNLNSVFLMTRALLPLLKQADDASLILTSSGVGRRGRAYWGAYAVSKFGIEGMVQVLADELANTSAIRVNSLNPGATNTAMRRSAYPAEEPTRNPDPEALMPLYLYLMGPDSRGVTGRQFDAQQPRG